MHKTIAERRYICSIWPGKLEPVSVAVGSDPSTAKGRRTMYELEPVKRGKKPYVIEVRDMFEDVPNVNLGDGSKLLFSSKPVDCGEIVNNCLNIWTRNIFGIPEGAGMGISEITNTAPTSTELDRLKVQLTSLMEWLFQEGERLDSEKKWKVITEPMRLSAEWLGRPRRWANPGETAQSSPCPFCQSIIPDAALVCNVCSRQVRVIPPELAALNKAPVLANA